MRALLCLSLLCACGPAPGRLTLTASGGASVENGFTTADGYTVTFTKVGLSVGEFTLATSAGQSGPTTNGALTVDLLEPAPRLVRVFENVPAQRWDAVSWSVGNDGGVSLEVEGALGKDNTNKTFAWSFTSDTLYSHCVEGVTIPSGGKAMDLSFEFKVLEMDATIEQMTLDVDGQVFRYAHGPQVPQRATWPGPRATNQVRIVTASAKDGEKYMVKSGPWALFRLFDEGEIRPGAGPERFIAALLIHGKRIVLEVTASSVQNPFRLREMVSFSCPGRI